MVSRLARSVFCVLRLALCSVALCSLPRGAAVKKIPRIGYLLFMARLAINRILEAFKQGLREHGYVEGKNIIIGVPICGREVRSVA